MCFYGLLVTSMEGGKVCLHFCPLIVRELATRADKLEVWSTVYTNLGPPQQRLTGSCCEAEYMPRALPRADLL
jgi:hypothetical protein